MLSKDKIQILTMLQNQFYSTIFVPGSFQIIHIIWTYILHSMERVLTFVSFILLMRQNDSFFLNVEYSARSYIQRRLRRENAYHQIQFLIQGFFIFIQFMTYHCYVQYLISQLLNDSVKHNGVASVWYAKLGTTLMPQISPSIR